MKRLSHVPVLVSAALSMTGFSSVNVRADAPASTVPPLSATTQEVPFLSCTLASLNAAERQRHAELITQLRGAIVEQRELPDGYAFRLGPRMTLTDLSAWIGLERRCCAFFGFTVEAKPGEDDLWLRLTGGGEVKAFIRAVVLADGSPTPAPVAVPDTARGEQKP